MPLIVHGRPDLVYGDDPSTWIAWDCQAHWNKGGGHPDPLNQPPNTIVPNTAHTHVVVHAPLKAELTGPITLPIEFKLFHCAGKLALDDWGSAWAFFATQAGQVRVPIVLDTPGPYLGDPNGAAPVTFKAHVVMDPALGSPHGYFSFYVGCRTYFDTGATDDTNCALNFFSLVDPSVPEPKYGEDVGTIVAKGTVVAPDHPQVFQATVMRTQDLNQNPLATDTLIEMILKGFSTPVSLGTASYNYGADKNFPEGGYQVIVGPDLHMGVPGVPLAGIKSSPVAGGSLNLDVIDPAVLASVPRPMGVPDDQQKIMFLWFADTGAGFDDEHGNHIPGGERFTILFTVTVKLSDHVIVTPDPMPMPEPTPVPPSPTPTPDPLPTPTPTPPPMETWTTIGTIEKSDQGRIRVCPAPDDVFCAVLFPEPKVENQL